MNPLVWHAGARLRGLWLRPVALVVLPATALAFAAAALAPGLPGDLSGPAVWIVTAVALLALPLPVLTEGRLTVPEMRWPAMEALPLSHRARLALEGRVATAPPLLLVLPLGALQPWLEPLRLPTAAELLAVWAAALGLCLVLRRLLERHSLNRALNSTGLACLVLSAAAQLSLNAAGVGGLALAALALWREPPPSRGRGFRSGHTPSRRSRLERVSSEPCSRRWASAWPTAPA